MDAGFSSLAKLKQHIWPQNWQEVDVADDQLVALGLGIRGLFESFCGRPFVRTAGAVETFPADTACIQLALTPVETLTSVELQTERDGSWTNITTDVQRLSKAGVVTLAAQAGTAGETLRVTFTGGYWWDTTENHSGSLPSGATAIPPAVQFAWFIQCKAVWASMETDSVKAAMQTGNLTALSNLINGAKLVPVVETMLTPFRRFVA